MSMTLAPKIPTKTISAYEPSASLYSRVCRRLTVKIAQNVVKIPKGRAIVSFSFDDCPVSGLENGVAALEKEGWLSTVYVACGLFGVENHLGKMMSSDDTKSLFKNGHEIGEHTFSHRDSKSMDLENFKLDIARNQNALADLGLPPSETFAYPYGETYPGLKKAMETKFKGSRGINKKVHVNAVDLNQIGSLPLYADTIDAAVEAVQNLQQTGGWLTFFTHDVRDNPSAYGCTPDNIKTIIEAVKESDLEVLTIKDAISAIEGNAA